MNKDLVELEAKLSLLHSELVAGSPTASAQLAELLLPSVLRMLERRFFNISDSHLLTTATIDAILTYLKKPERFDPEKGSLLYFTLRSATWKVLTALETNRELTIDSVELEGVSDVSKYEGEDELPVDVRLILQDEDSHTINRLKAILPDATDQLCLGLMMNGTRETDDYAAVLGISRESEEVKRREVKRVKDRIKITVRRRYGRNSTE